MHEKECHLQQHVRRLPSPLPPVTCSTSDARVSVACIALAKQLASEIFIPKSMRSYFMPIEFTPYVTSSYHGGQDKNASTVVGVGRGKDGG